MADSLSSSAQAAQSREGRLESLSTSPAAALSGTANPLPPGGNSNATSGADGSAAAVSLEAVEQRYVEVMHQLAAEPQLAVFKSEYEKLHRLFSKSREGERRLQSKVAELNSELSGHQTKTETAIALSQEDEASIAALRKEIEKAWAMADTAHTREVESRKAIQVLKKQVAELDALVEQSAGLSMGQETYLRELLNTKKEREEEHAVLQSKLERLTADHHGILRKSSAAQQQELRLATELEARTSTYQSLLAQLEEEQRERTAKEQSVRSYRSNTAQVVSELEKCQEHTAGLGVDERRLAKEAEETAATVQNLQRQLEERQARFQSESDRLSAVEYHNAHLKAEIPNRANQLREKQTELAALERQIKGLEGKAREQQNDLQELVKKRDELLLTTNAASIEMDKQLEQLQREEKELHAIEADFKKSMKEKTRTMVANSGKENARAETEGQRMQEESKRRRLAQDLSAALTDNESLRRQVFDLEQVQHGELTAAQMATLAYHRTLDHIRSRRADVRGLRDLLTVHEQKQKVQQELLDRVVSDRNRAEKQLRETENERRQLTEKHDAKREDIELMKSDLVSKEAALCQLHAINKQLQREITNTEQRASHLREDRNHASSRIEALQHEAQQLQQIIGNCDAEKAKQAMRLSAITNERNIIAAQLIRKNEELEFLYDKVQLQQNALDRGTTDYNQRAKKVIEARDRLHELRLRCRLTLVRLRYMQALKKKEMTVGKELTKERARVRALTEELRKPLNVHRWRQLEGSAPELLDSIAKVHMLQQAYIARCDELEAVTEQIEKRELEYVDLRRRLARLPGPEAAEDLALFKENIEKRQEQIAAMDGELTDVEEHAEVLTEEVRQLNRELVDVKRNYYQAKTKKDALERERTALRQTWGVSAAVARLAFSSRSAPPYTGAEGTGSLPHSRNLPGSSSSSRHGRYDSSSDGAAAASLNSSQQQQRVLGQQKNHRARGGQKNRTGAYGGSQQQQQHVALPHPQTQREAVIARESELLNALSTGTPAPNFPLQKPKRQKQFVGGGFALTR